MNTLYNIVKNDTAIIMSSSISYKFYSNTNLHECCSSIITNVRSLVTFIFYCRRCERNEAGVVVSVLLFSDQTSMLT